MSGLSKGQEVPAGNKYKHSILVTAFLTLLPPFIIYFSHHIGLLLSMESGR